MITDYSGKLVLKGQITGENTSIDISNFSKGIYFLRIGGRSQQTFKVLKQKSN